MSAHVLVVDDDLPLAQSLGDMLGLVTSLQRGHNAILRAGQRVRAAGELILDIAEDGTVTVGANVKSGHIMAGAELGATEIPIWKETIGKSIKESGANLGELIPEYKEL